MKYLFALLLFVISSNGLLAQSNSSTSKEITIDSEAFGVERKVSLFIPEDYDAGSNQKYQVIYIFDGQWQTMSELVWSMNTYLYESGDSQEFIMVGIHTENRPREFTPEPTDERTIENWGTTKVGESKLLDQHLLEEVIPYMEENYNVHPYRIGIGHSLGGTYVLNALTETPGLFNGFIAISPNLVYDYGSILDRLEKKLPLIKEQNSFVYMSVGDEGGMERNFAKGVKKLDSLLATTSIEGFHYEIDYLTETNHMTSFIKSLPTGLIEHSKLFGPPTDSLIDSLLQTNNFLLALKNNYKEQSDWLGYQFVPSEFELNDIAYTCLYSEKPEAGIEVLDWAISTYPNGINLYDSRAEIYLESGQTEKAVEDYELGLEKLQEHKDTISEEDYEYFLSMLNSNLAKAKESK